MKELKGAIAYCRDEPAPVIEALEPAADEGEVNSIYLLQILGSDHTAVLARDGQRSAATLNLETDPNRSQWGLGADLRLGKPFLDSLDDAARLAYIAKLIQLAEDDSDLALNRGAALR